MFLPQIRRRRCQFFIHRKDQVERKIRAIFHPDWTPVFHAGCFISGRCKGRKFELNEYFFRGEGVPVHTRREHSRWSAHQLRLVNSNKKRQKQHRDKQELTSAKKWEPVMICLHQKSKGQGITRPDMGSWRSKKAEGYCYWSAMSDLVVIRQVLFQTNLVSCTQTPLIESWWASRWLSLSLCKNFHSIIFCVSALGSVEIILDDETADTGRTETRFMATETTD